MPLADAKSTSSKTRWLAIVGLMIQVGLLGYVSGSRLFPLAVTLLAVTAGVTSWRFPLRESRRHWLYTVIGIGFLLSHLLSPFKFALEEQYVGTSVFHVLARLLIAVQLVTLFLKTETDRPPLWLAGVGTLCLPFALNIRVLAHHQQVLLWGVIAYVGVAALFSSVWRTPVTTSFTGRRWPRAVILYLTLAMSLLLGGGSALALQRYDRQIDWFLGEYLGYRPPSARPGFTTSGRLSDVSNWKTIQSNEIALWAFSDESPGYLRGMVFDTYRPPEWDQSWTVWSSETENQPLQQTKPLRGLPGVNEDQKLFNVTEQTQGGWSTIDVSLQNSWGLFYFTPLETAYISVGSGKVTRELHGTLQATTRPRAPSYSLIATDRPPRKPLDERLRTRTSTLDTNLSPQIRQLADELFANCRSNGEKIDRVQSWFQDNFEYQLGIDIPKGEDPLTYFLTTKQPANCEYFATGTAVLLRLAGVPSRYVTGYVAVERNDIGGYWMARNKDAHAWVEAYDDRKQQWVTVESTPAAGTPQPRSAPLVSQVPDAFQLYWSRLQNFVRDYGFGGMLLKLWDLIWSIPGLVVLILALIAPLLWRRRHLPQWHRRRDETRLQPMHALLSQLDQRAKRHDYQRQSDETLVQFANRLKKTDTDSKWSQTMADCYNLYATLRFRGQTGPDAISQVEYALSQVSHSRPMSHENTSHGVISGAT